MIMVMRLLCIRCSLGSDLTQSKESSFGSKISPLSFVPKRYLEILFEKLIRTHHSYKSKKTPVYSYLKVYNA